LAKNKEKIIITGLKILSKRTLIFELKCSSKVKEFFSCTKFVIEYPVNIDYLDFSILSIPALASIIGVAWVVGADVYVETVDQNFRESLDKIRLVMKKWYPNLPFSTKIFGESKINSYSADNFALLFSGGLDSTTSYIMHRERNLILISLSGEGESIDSQFKDNRMITPLSGEKDKILLVKTNIEKVINRKLVLEKFGLEWWMNLSHGLVLSGHCAPLTVVNNVGILYLASSFTRDFNYPWGSHPSIDNNICWGNTKVVHDGFETTRQEKIMYTLKEYAEEVGDFPTLKVCSKYQITGNNCLKCEKCSRTIVGLLAAGIDPIKCGFNINFESLNCIKESLEKGVFFSKRGLVERPIKLVNRIYPIFEWEDIQRNVPSDFKDMYGSTRFFDWFKDFDIKNRANKISFTKIPKLFVFSVFDLLAPLITILPRQIQNLLRSSFDYFFTNKRT
jgi:hypothetical protein